MSIKLLSASAFALALSLTAIPAFADVTITQQRSVGVYYGDLDLTTTTGAQKLLHRITRAAELACATPRPGEDLTAAGDVESCVKSAIDQAVTEVGSPLLAQAWEGSSASTVAQE